MCVFLCGLVYAHLFITSKFHVCIIFISGAISRSAFTKNLVSCHLITVHHSIVMAGKGYYQVNRTYRRAIRFLAASIL